MNNSRPTTSIMTQANSSIVSLAQDGDIYSSWTDLFALMTRTRLQIPQFSCIRSSNDFFNAASLLQINHNIHNFFRKIRTTGRCNSIMYLFLIKNGILYIDNDDLRRQCKISTDLVIFII
jgi:hypothetical protein